MWGWHAIVRAGALPSVTAHAPSSLVICHPHLSPSHPVTMFLHTKLNLHSPKGVCNLEIAHASEMHNIPGVFVDRKSSVPLLMLNQWSHQWIPNANLYADI